MKTFDLSGISTPRLKKIREVLANGILATAENTGTKKLDNSKGEIMEEKEFEAQKEALKTAEENLKTAKADLEAKSTAFDELTKEHTDLKTEVEELRSYKQKAEEAAERAERLKTRKARVVDAGLEIDIDAEADKWLEMSDDAFEFTISKMEELNKEIKKASASKKEMKVPNITDNVSSDSVATVREGLKERKNKRENK